MPGPGIPEIKWGTFHDKFGVSHVAPAIEEHLMEGHKLCLTCPCGPRIDRDLNFQIVVHYVVH
jgi:hypothetical protein